MRITPFTSIFSNLLATRINPSFWLYVALILLPTQLSYHFWPAFTRVQGYRQDYLSPAIYLTDLVLILLLIHWFIDLSPLTMIQRLSRMFGKVGLGILLIFGICNITFAYIPILSFINFLHLLKWYLLTRFIIQTTDLDFPQLVRCFKVSLLYTSLIGIAQFSFQSSIGGPFWWLGERTFTVTTPSIATVLLDNQQYLRAYSTFSHPNSFAGFLVVGLVIAYGRFLFFQMNFKERKSMADLFIIISTITALLLTFSRTALITLVFLGLLALIKIFLKYSFKLDLMFTGLVSILFPVGLISLPSLYQATNLPILESLLSSLSVQQRIIQYQYTLQMFSRDLITGAGLDNYLPALAQIPDFRPSLIYLQPVHNIAWLGFAEIGLIGVAALSLCIYLQSASRLPQDSIEEKSIVAALLAIFATGATDHYWYTLAQNQFLAILIFGLIFKYTYTQSSAPLSSFTISPKLNPSHATSP